MGQNVPMTISADDSGPVRIVTAVLRDGNRVLLCHRSAGRRWYPDVWDLPGGHAEEGEDPKESLEVDSCVEHRGDEDVPQHVWVVGAADAHAANLGEMPQSAGGGMPVHPGSPAVEQDRPRRPPPMARSNARPTAGGSGMRTTLVPLPRTRRTRWTCSSPRSAMLALVGFEDPRPSSPSIATRAKSYGLADSRLAVSMASNCRCVKPSVGASGGTAGRRTWSAGEWSSTPSMTAVR